MDKYLIVNADDFGLDEGINRGIAACFEEGIIRSVSIVPNGSAFEHALILVKKNTGIGMGVHLCLVGEKPILSKEKIPTLTDEGGSLYKDYRRFFFGICGKRISLSEIEGELEAQIKKVLENGIRPTHLDSHQYTHLIPPVFNIVIKLAKRYGIKWIRCPTPLKHSHYALSGSWVKKVYLLFSSLYHPGIMKKNGIRYADFSHGVTVSGRLNERLLKGLLEALSVGINDITCHPGYSLKDSRYESWRYRWEEEASAMKSEGIKNTVKRLNIKLTNYAV